MSNKLLKACSVLPVFAVCGMISTVGLTSAKAAVVDIEEGQLFENQKNEVSDERAGALTISYGDSLSNSGVNNVTFKNNSSVNSGGAMKALNGFTAGDGWTFEGNTSNKMSGGLYVKIPETEDSDRNISFGKNTVFKGNSSKWLGGALGIEAAENFVMGDGALFEKNSTEADGGAIAIWTDKSNGVTVGSNLTLGQSVFKGNTAANRGGAIANLNNDKAEDKTDFYNTVNIGANSLFENNSAKTGGAIYNLGTMNIAENTQFVGNSADNTGGYTFGGAIYNEGDLEIEGATFSENRAENQGYGGAIFNASGGLLNVNNSVFEGNSAEWDGGAISSTTSHLNPKSLPADWDLGEWSVENVRKYWEKKNGFDAANKMVITNSTFSNNTVDSYSGGALGVYSDAVIDNTKFVGNNAGGHTPADSVDGGGAIYAGGWARVDLSNSEFTGNSSNYGGAIATTRAGLEDDTRLHITNSKFAENKATVSGGAISNKFQDAVINNSVFTGNTADVSGGAIYNEAVAKMEFAGNNVFAGNTAAGVANDIHNDGVIDVASGTTTIGSGISGTGSLNIVEGATLNIGTTTVQQDSINLEGTLAAQIVNANSFGKLQISEISVGENGVLDLTLGSVGTYDFGTIVPVEKIAYNNSVYNISFDENNQMIVSTKSVDEIVSNTNLSSNAATTVSVLANVENDLLNTISLRAQQDLAAGNVERVEAETAKLNPDDKPVAQSVATSVQNQVLSLAAGRMSGAATVGRSGGDLANADYGVWAQGLYNHSKYNGKFTGDTMGISVGADTLIDGKYTVGIGYAYNDTDVDSNSRDTDIESNSIFVYGQYKPAEWYINAALNYTMSNYKESADPYGILHESEYDVTSFGGQVAAGYDFAFGLTPEVGVRYLNVSQDAYESLMGHVDGVDTNYLTGVAGVKYAFEIETDSELSLRPELRAAATYDFLSDSAVATITAPGNLSYVIDADRLSRLGGEFGIGLVGNYKGVEVSLNYDLDLHEDYTSHTGMLKFRYNF